MVKEFNDLTNYGKWCPKGVRQVCIDSPTPALIISTFLILKVGFTFEVHNGKSFKTLNITDQMIGYKLGEFVPTRVYPKHPDLKKNKQQGRK